MKTKSLVIGLFLLTLFSGNLEADELEEALRGFDDFDKASTNDTAKTPAGDLGDLDESGFDEVDTNKAGVDISNSVLHVATSSTSLER